MTEQEWLVCKHVNQMLAFVKTKAGSRKLRLFACACCRRIWHKLPGKRRAVLAAEQFVDRMVSAKELAAFESSVRGTSWSAQAVRNACGPTKRFLYSGAYLSSLFAGMAAAQRKGEPASPASKSAGRREEAFQIRLLRDIVGNPFHTVAVDPGWRTGTVVSLAKGAYEKRMLPSGELEPVRLAILADAVEEAGCTDPQLLEHLRGSGPHVRGCWAVDLVLGKK